MLDFSLGQRNKKKETKLDFQNENRGVGGLVSEVAECNQALKLFSSKTASPLS